MDRRARNRSDWSPALIEALGLLAFVGGCALAFRLGRMRGFVLGQQILDEQHVELHVESRRLCKKAKEAEQLLNDYAELFELAAPILQEHTWNRMNLDQTRRRGGTK